MIEATKPEAPAQDDDARGANRDYSVGLVRAFGGAIIFGLPLLMTMEMWHLGFALQPHRQIVFQLVNILLLIGLSRFGGFERTCSLTEDILDAFAAYGVGIIASAAVLAVFGIVTPDMPASELVGKVAVQSVPASFGAMLARKQLSAGGAEQEQEEQEEEEAVRGAGYGGQLFLMTAGALYLAFNVAPTEEMILIGFIMSPLHEAALVVASLIILHGFVYNIGFAGQEERPEGAGFVRTFIVFTVVGYAIALLVSGYALWIFGRTDGAALNQIVAMTVVLGFPAALGAAIARLVV